MSKKIAEIKNEFAAAGKDQLMELFAVYAEDSRAGVAGLIKQYRRKLELIDQEKQRLHEMKAYEREYGHLGYICGIDEAGRGPLAGPVVAGAVILPDDCEIMWLNDSKQLSEKKREVLYEEIMEKAIAAEVGIVGPGRIDEINILQATYEAMREAVGKLKVTPQILLNDAVTIPNITLPQVPIIKGDAKSLSIAAASIIAKVTRDRLMREYDHILPEYGFAGHKGYGSSAHIEAIHKFGPSPIHRRSFIKSIEIPIKEKLFE